MITKFRAWDKEGESWIDIKSLGMMEGEITTLEEWDDDLPYFIEDLGKTWEIMQSTGLHDKKTKEIYYDDILKCDDGTLLVVDDVRTHSFLDLNMHLGYEVIGNIHEHSHLLDDGGQQQ